MSKVVIVTGCSSGIGKTIVSTLLESGYIICGIDCKSELGFEQEKHFQKLNMNFKYVQCDLSNAAEIVKSVDFIKSQFTSCNGIVNNAAISLFENIEDITFESFDKILTVNLKAPFLLTKLLKPLLDKSQYPSIVNIASTRAIMSEPNNEAYAASKAGLLGLTHALANSLGPKIRVNAICPGWINTSDSVSHLTPRDHQQHLVGRVGKSSDISSLVEYLLSDKSEFITGQSFVVDGGMTKKMIYV